MIEWLALLLRIQEISGSILVPKTGFSEGFLSHPTGFRRYTGTVSSNDHRPCVLPHPSQLIIQFCKTYAMKKEGMVSNVARVGKIRNLSHLYDRKNYC
jgi:hypothetical protein